MAHETVTLCNFTIESISSAVEVVLIYLSLTPLWTGLSNGLLTIVAVRCKTINQTVRSYLVTIGICSLVYSLAVSADAIYTLSQYWFGDVCNLMTTTRTCITRLAVATVFSSVVGYYTTALSVDRWRATRAMMKHKPTFMLDTVPWKVIAGVFLATIAATVAIFWSAITNDRPIAVCSLQTIVDDQNVAIMMMPIVCMYLLNVVMIRYVGKQNTIVYDRFVVTHVHQSLEMRTQLKRNLSTSRALLPAVEMVAGTYAVLIAIFAAVPLMGSSTATRHFTGHVLNAGVLTLNSAFAVLVLYKHKELRQKMCQILVIGSNSSTGNNKVTPAVVVYSTAHGVVDEGNFEAEGDKYYASLALDWAAKFHQSSSK